MSIPSADPARREAYEQSREVTRAHAKSFYFASHVLPADRRAAAYAVYAFCRAADDAIDEAKDASTDELRRRLDALRGRLDAIFADRNVEPGPDLALADVARRFQLERAPFEALLQGMEIDLVPVRFTRSVELEDYCYKVAGVVGHMLLPIFGARAAEARARAADLGTAMQLTNILRDVGEDLDRGRIYLPEEELQLFGLSHADVEARRVDDRWRLFMEAQVQRARWYYARADLGVPLIETWGGRLCTRVMRAVYGDILRVIERRGYDTFHDRAKTNTARKVALLGFGALNQLPTSAKSRSLPPAPDGPLALPPPAVSALALPASGCHALRPGGVVS